MIKTMLCCDMCGKELKPSYSLIMESQTKEWSMKQFVFCKECALTIDNAILRFKNKVLNGDTERMEQEGK